jgi:SAM-dependent methyltransferase
MGWTEGYVSDIEYTTGYYQEQNPVLLNFAALVNGYEAPRVDRAFTYFELGFGRGETVSLLAASLPQGRFYAADFNPAHVAGATSMAQSAALENLVLLENSFEELAAGAVALPQFDFITLHGIYTWVTAENRRHIVDFIAKYLKPGGIVYASYNAMPGWTAALPLQRFLVEFGDAFPNRSDVQVGNATEFIDKMIAAEVNYFSAPESLLKVRLDGLKKHKPSYLVHEYMHKHWQPMYHADVARDFAEAKLEFVASAELSEAYPNLFLSQEKLQLIAAFPDPVMRETMKDYCRNVGFRKDVFVRGARRLEPLRRAELLRQTGIALLVSRDAVQLDMQLSIGSVTAKAELCLPICDALAHRPHTLGELEALAVAQGRGIEDVAQIAVLLVASKQAVLCGNLHGPVSQSDSSRRMNLVIAGKTRYADEFRSLCSGVVGGAVPAESYVQRLVYWLIAGEGIAEDVQALAQAGWKIMKAQGRQLVKDGVVLEGEQEGWAEFSLHVQTVLQQQLPVWRKLNML